jgi:hypothetical protein
MWLRLPDSTRAEVLGELARHPETSATSNQGVQHVSSEPCELSLSTGSGDSSPDGRSSVLRQDDAGPHVRT